jgi:hypothetical protein
MSNLGGRVRGGRDDHGGRGPAGRFGQRSGSFRPSFSAIKLMDRDPGMGHPIWMGGAASLLIMARPFLRARAKAAGLYSYWTGDKDTDFPVNRPTLNYAFDSTFDPEYHRPDSEMGEDMIAWSRGQAASSGRQAPAAVANNTYKIWRFGEYVTTVEPYLTDRRGDTDLVSKLTFGPIVNKINDFILYNETVVELQDQTMKWISAYNKHQERVSKASAVLTGCLTWSDSAFPSIDPTR